MIDFHRIGKEIAAAISGRVIYEGDREYPTSLGIDNGRISHQPKFIVVPAAHRIGVGTDIDDQIREELIRDVQATVRICSREGAKLTVKSGGHGATGYCLNSDGVVLDLRNLNWIRFSRDSGRLRCGMGQRFYRVYDFLESTRTGRIPIGGGCPTVGLGGFLLGGGYSFVSRSYGLGADNVAEFKVVLADGDLIVVGEDSSDASAKELFWGLRGGGGGNFGVVVEGDLKTHVPHETMMVGQVQFPFHRIPEILEFYNEWVVDLPRRMAVYGFLGSQLDPRIGGNPVLSLRLTPVYNGKFTDGVDLLKPLLNLQPISLQLFNMTLHEWEDLIGTGTVVDGRSAYIRSVVMKKGAMTRDVATIFLKHMTRRPSASSFVVWTHAGGQIAETDASQTAFPHRDAWFVPEVKAIWDSKKPEEMRPNVEWAHEFFTELAGHGCGAFINYIDPLQQNWKQAYYGDNYSRLERLRSTVDPKHFFKFQQSIGSAFEPDLVKKPLNLGPLQIT